MALFRSTKAAKTKRQKALRARMQELGLNPRSLAEKVYPTDAEKAGKLKQRIGNIGPGCSAYTSVSDAELLAPALGVKAMDLLLRYTTKETKAEAASNGQPDSDAVEPAAEKEFRKNAFEKFVAGRSLNVRSIALRIVGDRNADEVALHLAAVREGEEMLTLDDARRIANEYNVEVSSFLSGLTAEEKASEPAPTRRGGKRGGRRPGKPAKAARGGRKASRRWSKVDETPTDPAEAGTAKVKTFDVSGDELVTLVGTQVWVSEEGGDVFVTARRKVPAATLLRILLK